MPPQNITRRR